MKNKLYELRQDLRKAEKSLGLDEFTETEKAVYALIQQTPTYRESIIKDGYFKNISLSTMKRAVQVLLESERIEAKVDVDDNRKRLLYIV